MGTFHENILEYKKLLQQGAIQAAYKGLMEYFLSLRNYFKTKYPDYFVSSNIYYGYMDMTYFSFFPESLKERKLKVAIVFLHREFRFEVWLAGINKQVQEEYWKIIKASGWQKYTIVSNPKETDSILEHILVEDPDFSDLDGLSNRIERETLAFIEDIEKFLSMPKE